MFSIRMKFAVMLFSVVSASSALAGDWTRETVGGGEISRSVDQSGRHYSGTTTRTGPNGAHYTSSTTCLSGIVDRCHRSYSATGASGKTVSGQRAISRGPYARRSVGVITGPNGNTAVGVRRHWR